MNAEGENTRTVMKAKKANRRTQKKKIGVKAAKNSTRKAPKAPQKKKPRTAHEYTEIGLQDLAILLFGEETVHEVKKKMDVREIWNVSTNTTQCNNVIGKVNAETPCWICGLKIDATDPGMSPECEHVLPVAQAVIYLSLYSAKKKHNTTPERNARKMEYGWAHTVCNQDKSDICCMVNAGDKAAVSDKNIKYILRKIYTSNRVDSVKIKSELKGPYPTLESFIDGRLGPMRKRYQDIVDYLNPSSGENRFKLTILAGLVTAMDYSNIREEAQALLSPEFLAEKEQQKAEKAALKQLKAKGPAQELAESKLKELSTEFLGKYKKAAYADAKKADAEGDYARGDKRFKGINRATNKQFDNDLKKHGQKSVSEVKQRLDPKCWKGKHKEGTKIKGGVRVNNCVPNEGRVSIGYMLEEIWQQRFNK